MVLHICLFTNDVSRTEALPITQTMVVCCCETYDGIRILNFSYETPWLSRLQKFLDSETGACILNILLQIFVYSACILCLFCVVCYLQEVQNTVSRLLILSLLSMFRLINHSAADKCFLGRLH